ncbi:hypothetical protein SFC07_05725, partial [Corynebacterium callunae]|uniref:hypothetical protein n=1 Tax=Corynebacterium callunae TaxID=1721 RepID=UPI003982683C
FIRLFSFPPHQPHCGGALSVAATSTKLHGNHHFHNFAGQTTFSSIVKVEVTVEHTPWVE